MATHHNHLLSAVLVLLLLQVPSGTTADSIGVNYGTKGSDLPPPPKVVNFLRTRTIIDRVKLFDTNANLLKAFADSNISVVMTAANGDIPSLTDPSKASKWVESHVKPYYPKTKISCIAVGNEILHSLDYSLIDNLVPAMKTLHGALVKAGYKDIRVSTPSSLGILNVSEPPSAGRFQKGWDVGVLKPMLEFLSKTKSPFMVNPYPYFGFDPRKIEFATFQPNDGKVDDGTKLTYYNVFDQNMDAIYSAMKKVGYGDVEMMVAETGWPSLANPDQPEINVKSAAAYNGGLIKHVNSGKGTPLMPNRTFEAYIFSLFNEKDKDGPTAERNFGLFKPDFTPVYDSGVMLKQPKKGTTTKSADSPAKSTSGDSPTEGPSSPTEGPSGEGGSGDKSPAKSEGGSGAKSPAKSDGGSGPNGDEATGKTDGAGGSGPSGDVTQDKSVDSSGAPGASGVASGSTSMMSSDGQIRKVLMVVAAAAMLMGVDAFWL